MMQFSEISGWLTKRGYIESEPKKNHRVFYEFGAWDFMVSDAAKKFEFECKEGKVDKIVMVQYWFGTTTFKEITEIEDLYDNT